MALAKPARLKNSMARRFSALVFCLTGNGAAAAPLRCGCHASSSPRIQDRIWSGSFAHPRAQMGTSPPSNAPNVFAARSSIEESRIGSATCTHSIRRLMVAPAAMAMTGTAQWGDGRRVINQSAIARP